MSVMGMKPLFTDRESYLAWMRMWRAAYNRLSEDIRRQKGEVANAFRTGQPDAARKHKLLGLNQATAYKMMTLRKAALDRRDRIIQMQRDIADQGFPLDLGDCRNVDFHYNRAANDFSFLPMWVVRVKGRSYYVNEVVANAPWSTHERATGSTRGTLRFKRARLRISEEGVATITDIAKSLENRV